MNYSSQKFLVKDHNLQLNELVMTSITLRHLIEV